METGIDNTFSTPSEDILEKRLIAILTKMIRYYLMTDEGEDPFSVQRAINEDIKSEDNALKPEKEMDVAA